MVAMRQRSQTTEAVSMETMSYVVRVDVCVVPLQPVVQDGDDHSFPRDAFLPHGDHVQVQLRQRGGRARVLLEEAKRQMYTHQKKKKNPNETERKIRLSTSSKQPL